MRGELNLSTEKWKDIEGFEGYYQVSNHGNVRSLDRTVYYVDGRVAKYKGQPVASNIRPNGYVKVNLYRDHKMKNLSVHRLVALAFVPNPNKYPIINHIDEIKNNNHFKNLEWCTSAYNSNYGTGKYRSAAKNSVPVKGVHRETGDIVYLKSMADGSNHGFTPTGISDVCLGRYETHRGYVFTKLKGGTQDWRYL